VCGKLNWCVHMKVDEKQDPRLAPMEPRGSTELQLKTTESVSLTYIYLFQFTQYSVAEDRQRETERQKKNYRNTIKTYTRKLNTC